MTTESSFRGRRFWKMHSSGNTVVLFERPSEEPSLEEVRTLLGSERGIAGDNLLCFSFQGCPKGLDCVVDGFNADGTRVGVSANGARCLAHLAKQNGFIDESVNSLEILMDETRVSTEVLDSERGLVSILVPPPSFDPAVIPFGGSSSAGKITLGADEYEYVVVNVGNPHCVLFVDRNPSEAWVSEVAKQLEEDPKLFPEKVNVALCLIENEGTVHTSLYERGVGVTPSSGAAALAVGAACRSFKGAGERIEVVMQGGLEVFEWVGGGKSMRTTNVVETICEGRLSDEFSVFELQLGRLEKAA